MYQDVYDMSWCPVWFPSRVTGSIQEHRGQNKKQQQHMACSFPLNAQERCESEIDKKVEDDKGQITISSVPSPLFGIQFLAIPFAFDFAFKIHFKEKSFKHSINKVNDMLAY